MRRALQLNDAGDAPAAERLLAEHLRSAPHDADARVAHGVVLQRLGRAPDAAASYRQALAVRPSDPIAQCNLGVVLRELGEFDAAEEVLRAAVAERPEFVPALGNLGLVLCDLDRPEDATEPLEKAAALSPQAAEIQFALAGAYSAMYRLEDAKASYRRALALRPEFVPTRWNLSHLELLTESFHEGWELFESRWALEPLASRRWSGAQPQWAGQDLRGKTLYVFSEQGFGDTIQFVRYVPLAVQRGATVILRVQPELLRLASTLEGVHDVGPTGGAPPACDYYCPIMSLPRGFGTTLETIPAAVPYFTADRDAVAGWRRRLGERGPLRVGLVWSSGIRHYERSIFYAGVAKSMTLAQLAPLGGVRDVVFYSLQKGEAAREAARPPPGMRLVGLLGRARRLRGLRRADRGARPADLGRYRRRPRGRRAREAGVEPGEVSRLLALAPRPPGFAVVPDDAALPATRARRLDKRRRGGRPGAARARRRAAGQRRVRTAPGPRGASVRTRALSGRLRAPPREKKRPPARVAFDTPGDRVGSRGPRRGIPLSRYGSSTASTSPAPLRTTRRPCWHWCSTTASASC